MSLTYLEIADVLWETGALLRLAKASNRRSSAFIKAAEIVENLGTQLWKTTRDELLQQPRLTTEVVDAILTLREQHNLPLHDELIQKFGENITQLLRLQGIGRTTAIAIKETLGITTLDELQQAIQNRSLLQVKGIGERLFQQLQQSLPQLQQQLQQRQQQILLLKQQLDQLILENKQPEPSQTSDTPEPSQTSDTPEERRKVERTFGGLLRSPESGEIGFEVMENEAICLASGERYPIFHGVVDFLGDEIATPTWTQSIMEQAFYSKFYENIFRPKLTRFVTSRSIKRDIKLSLFELKLEPDWIVLDLACGTGNYARAIAKSLDEERGFVIAVDISWSMLRKASKYREEEGVVNLHFVRASAEKLPLIDGQMDAAHCTGAFHLFPNKREALKELHRVLKVGGRLVIGTFLQGESSLVRHAQAYSEQALGFKWFDHDELIELIETNGFKVERVNIAGLAVTVTAIRLPEKQS